MAEELPDWLLVIRDWVPSGMGARGITLSFLAGALAYKAGRTTIDRSDLVGVLNEISSNPVEGIVVQVQWCHDIDAPVLSISSNASPMPLKYVQVSSNGGHSLGFSDDVSSCVGGLCCNSIEQCREKLIEHFNVVATGSNFSRRRSANGEWTYGLPTGKEESYIKYILGVPAV